RRIPPHVGGRLDRRRSCGTDLRAGHPGGMGLCHTESRARAAVAGGQKPARVQIRRSRARRSAKRARKSVLRMLPSGSERQDHRYSVSLDVARGSETRQARSRRRRGSQSSQRASQRECASPQLRQCVVTTPLGTAATMGLAVGVWTTVARRTARVEAELVGGSAIDGIFCDGLRSSHAKRLRSAREIEAQCRQETIRTQTNHRSISITRFQTDHGEVRMSYSVCILRRACIPLFAVLAGLLLSGCGVNNIPTYDESAKAKWSDVQNQHPRRADVVSNLVGTVKGYAAQEREVLTQVTEARAKASQIKVDASTVTDPAKFKEFRDAQNALTGALGRLLVTIERYPDLK